MLIKIVIRMVIGNGDRHATGNPGQQLRSVHSLFMICSLRKQQTAQFPSAIRRELLPVTLADACLTFFPRKQKKSENAYRP